MRIAVDAVFLQSRTSAEVFIKELFWRLAAENRDSSFFFLVDNSDIDLTDWPANITSLVVTPRRTNLVKQKWWYDVKLPLALKKYNADIFIGANGSCSLTTTIPQVLIVQTLSLTKQQTSIYKSNLSFYKTYIPRFLRKATAVISFSDFLKKQITHAYSISDTKITVINIAVDSTASPLNWEEREEVKEKYAGGCEYFIFFGNPVFDENLINVLKAFSNFKKWQKTNMKLLLAIDSSAGGAELEKLNSYKYKSEVLVVENLSRRQSAQIIAGAYAMIFTSSYKTFAGPVLQAMQSEVPVITSAESDVAEIIGDAALYANPENPAEVADKMRLIFKDEQLRTKMVIAGRKRATGYSWDKTTSSVFQLLEQLVSR